jgi:hypothetical protein
MLPRAQQISSLCGSEGLEMPPWQYLFATIILSALVAAIVFSLLTRLAPSVPLSH